MALRIRNIFKNDFNRNVSEKRKTQQSAEETYERCVVCGELTDIPIDTPIEFRNCYEIGLGQVCFNCHKEIEEEEQNQPATMQYIFNQCK